LMNRPVGSVTFCDASFWGNVARNLIVQKGNRRPIVVPQHRMDKMEILYWLKCQSVGRVVDPFSLSLEFQGAVDPKRWSSAESLLTFAKAEPNHPLSRSLRSVCGKIFALVFDGNEAAFPMELLRTDDGGDAVGDGGRMGGKMGGCHSHHGREFYLKFVRNVRAVDAAVPRVESKLKPPKLVDVFQRLLALADVDALWEETPPPLPPSDECTIKSFFEMYLQLVAAETEIENLKRIMDAPHPEQQRFGESARTPFWVKRTILGSGKSGEEVRAEGLI
jgi:hypothetical protein